MAEARQQERDAQYVNPVSSFARGRAVERAVTEKAMRDAYPEVDRLILQYRGINADGGLTPGQAIEEEARLRGVLRDREPFDARADRLPPGKRAEAKRIYEQEGLDIAERELRLQRAREGGVAPSEAEIRERRDAIVNEVRVEGDVKTQVEVKISADEGFVARIVRQVTEAVGIRATNGAGSVGTSLPEASAPRIGGGGP